MYRNMVKGRMRVGEKFLFRTVLVLHLPALLTAATQVL